MPGGLTTFTTFSPLEAAEHYLDGQPDDVTVAVALSGGGDSVGLLAALNEAPACRSGRIRLAAITIDHGLRSESAGEAAAMADFCRALSIPHLTLAWRGEKPRTGLSEAAREARYRLLAEGARQLGADCLVTAHTLDDQLETVEMRRRRSETSLRGLAGIAPAALFFGTLAVHRPFLRVLRAEIRTYLSGRGIRWIDDPSNENPLYERVRVRQAGQFAIDADAIDDAARRRVALAEGAAAHLQAHARMPLPMLFALDLAEADKETSDLALATLIAIAGGQLHLPGREQLERLRLRLRTDGGNAAVSLGRTVVERRKGVLYIGRDRRNLPSVDLLPGESIDWDGRFRINNDTHGAVTVRPADAGEGCDAVPARIGQRALSTLPDCGALEPDGTGLVARPLLAPFETVLPSFDQPLADAMCGLTRRPIFPGFVSAGLETASRRG